MQANNMGGIEQQHQSGSPLVITREEYNSLSPSGRFLARVGVEAGLVVIGEAPAQGTGALCVANKSIRR